MPTSRAARRMILCTLLAAGCVAAGHHGGAVFDREELSGPAPWTDAPLRDSADEFTFAVVTDRTGEHREGVFEEAIEKLGLLGSRFVVSVGD